MESPEADSPELLEDARSAFERRDWAAALDGFKAVKGKVEFEPFGRLDRSTLRELAGEAEHLAAFHA